jgi:diguanylate cyclase (GGDEF)-like protein
MKKTLSLVAALVIYSLAFWLALAYAGQSALLGRVSYALEDVLFKARYSSESLPASRDKLLIVAIDDESSFRLGLRWPWPRTKFAQILDELHDKGASSIGLNFTFSGLENGDEASTLALAEAVKKSGKAVVGTTLEAGRLIKPNPILLRAGVRYGFLEKRVDDDFVIRRAYISQPDRARISEEPSFPLALRRVEGKDDLVPAPSGEDEGTPINYLVKAKDLKAVSAWKLLDGHVPRELIAGKTVLVGITSSLLSEEHRTPLGLMPGVLVHANEWIALEEDRPLRAVSAAVSAGAAWLVGAVLLILFVTHRYWFAVPGFVLSFFLSLLLSQILFARDLVMPLFTLILGPLTALASAIAANLVTLLLENKGLTNKVIQDKMTGLFTYDHLRVRLDDEWKRCSKLSLPVSIVMTDLDRFKKINDTLGHEVGNQMILRAANVIRESVRGYDVVSRYGGDEFVILLWHANHAEAAAYKQRLRDSYAKMAAALDDAMLKTSSISIGHASFDPKADGAKPESPQQLVEWADKALFEDKESRRKPGEEKR